MSNEIKVPSFPESVADGSVSAWHKQVGDTFARDEIIADVETDKVMFEVPAPANGRLTKIHASVGDTVLSNAVLAEFEPVEKAELRNEPTAESDPESASTGQGANPSEATPLMTPAARFYIEEKGLDPKQVSGSGKGGRILKEDVMTAVPGGVDPSPAVAENEREKDAVAETESPGSRGNNARHERREPMSRLRARIAERLVEAQHTTAMLTTFNEVDMAPVMELRSRYREAFEKRHGARLGFMSFFILAATEALKSFPEVNASIEGDSIVYHDYFDIGVAVASPRGLVVPVVRDVDSMSMAGIETAIADFASRAGAGKLELDEISGGTFTITNGGVFGSMLSTPIINPPQSAILGMHKIEKRPVVINDEIVVRPMMYLALSYDHRLIDGSSAVRFLVSIKESLEDPARILLEV